MEIRGTLSGLMGEGVLPVEKGGVDYFFIRVRLKN
jgi:hypothetical protein